MIRITRLAKNMASSNDLPPALRMLLPPALQAISRARPLARGERLFLQRQRPHHMYFVTRGEVVLERLGQQGDKLVLQRVRHGFVAEASLQSAAYHCDALVTASGDAVALALEPLRAALALDPDFAQRWIAMLSAEVRRLRGQCERLSLRSVRDRLQHLIESEGVDGELGIDAGLKSLATELAVTHEALYRTVAALEKEGVLRREAQCIVLR